MVNVCSMICFLEIKRYQTFTVKKRQKKLDCIQILEKESQNFDFHHKLRVKISKYINFGEYFLKISISVIFLNILISIKSVEQSGFQFSSLVNFFSKHFDFCQKCRKNITFKRIFRKISILLLIFGNFNYSHDVKKIVTLSKFSKKFNFSQKC